MPNPESSRGPSGATAVQQMPKICPILSMASMLKAPPEEKVIRGLGGPLRVPAQGGPTAVACQGQACMWFMPIVQEGKVVDGNCSVTLLTNLGAMMNDTIHKVGAALAPAAFVSPDAPKEGG